MSLYFLIHALFPFFIGIILSLNIITPVFGNQFDFILKQKIKFPSNIIWIENFKKDGEIKLLVQTDDGNIHQLKKGSLNVQNIQTRYDLVSEITYSMSASKDSKPLVFELPNENNSQAFIILENGSIGFLNLKDKNERIITETTKLSPFSHPVFYNSEEIQKILAISKNNTLVYIDPINLSVLESNITNLLYDSRIIVEDIDNDNSSEVLIFSNPSERYPHGALGDRVEAQKLLVLEICPEHNKKERDQILCISNSIVPPDNNIFESASPVIVNIVNTNNDHKQISLVVSDVKLGSKVIVYNTDSRPILASEPIGKSFRWTLIIGDGYFNGQRLVINETPHLHGVLKFIDSSGNITNVVSGYSSHNYGSRNIDLSLIYKNNDRLCIDAYSDKNSHENNDIIIIPDMSRMILNAISISSEDTVTIYDRILLEQQVTSNLFFSDIYNKGKVTLVVGDNSANLYIFECV